ncbi:MAG: dihydrodipicolinate synthase family protein [Thermoguttaceae bacterium]|nr:dihydrodipicolinate synthase family protein [Thermoguttaceae bacterium]
MKKTTDLGRRRVLGMMGTAAVAACGLGTSPDITPCAAAAPTKKVLGDPRVRGPFPILSTPYTQSGEVDFDVLGRQAQFVDWCGSPGMIWPQSGDSVDLLTMDEKLKGMDVLAKAMKGRTSALCLGVQGNTTEEMLVYAKHAEKLAPDAIISRPPDSGKTQEDMRKYWYALAKVVHRPVIIQTTGGTQYRGPAPSVDLLIELGKEFPHFGYVKEEAADTMERMRKLLAARPAIKRIFSAAGGFGWLHQCRIGSEGLVTERAVYADLLAFIWKSYDEGKLAAANDAFAKLLLMLNLKDTIPGNQLRGYHLYVWQKRGIFKNTLSRQHGPKDSIPKKPVLSDMKLTPDMIEEIDMRFESLAPYLKKGKFA